MEISLYAPTRGGLEKEENSDKSQHYRPIGVDMGRSFIARFNQLFQQKQYEQILPIIAMFQKVDPLKEPELHALLDKFKFWKKAAIVLAQIDQTKKKKTEEDNEKIRLNMYASGDPSSFSKYTDDSDSDRTKKLSDTRFNKISKRDIIKQDGIARKNGFEAQCYQELLQNKKRKNPTNIGRSTAKSKKNCGHIKRNPSISPIHKDDQTKKMGPNHQNVAFGRESRVLRRLGGRMKKSTILRHLRRYKYVILSITNLVFYISYLTTGNITFVPLIIVPTILFGMPFNISLKSIAHKIRSSLKKTSKQKNLTNVKGHNRAPQPHSKRAQLNKKMIEDKGEKDQSDQESHHKDQIKEGLKTASEDKNATEETHDKGNIAPEITSFNNPPGRQSDTDDWDDIVKQFIEGSV